MRYTAITDQEWVAKAICDIARGKGCGESFDVLLARGYEVICDALAELNQAMSDRSSGINLD